jgi:cysteine desulfurase
MSNFPIYLDHAAATPVDEQVLAAMRPFFSEKFHNPSGIYLAARQVGKELEAARSSVAAGIGAKRSEIVFTAGGTEANNLAIRGVMGKFPDGVIVTSTIEHDSVLAPAGRYTCRQTAVTPGGIVDLEAFKQTLQPDVVLVSIQYANNETGTIQPLRRIAALVEGERERRRRTDEETPLYLHTDAAQAANYLDLHVSRLGVDMMTLNGGKIYGPKQSGCLFVSSRVTLEPQILGGGQEGGIRSGTENVAGSVGFAAALEAAQRLRKDETERLKSLQGLFVSLLAERLPDVAVNGTMKHRLPNNVHVTIPGADNESLLFALDEAGIICAAGSACSASSDEPSHVLKAIGLSDADARSSLRFTMGRATRETDVRSAVDTLARLVA